MGLSRPGGVPRASPHEPVVNIIVNNYNYARFLGAAIDSALAQTYLHTQVLVVDDGSTDESQAVIAAYGGQVVPLYKPNGGQASAINLGFERASGDIIMFLDADDLLLPETAARVAARFRAQPDLARVQFRLAVVDAEGRRTGMLKPPLNVALPHGDVRAQTLACPFDVPWLSLSGNAFPRRVLHEILPAPEHDYTPTGVDFYLVHLSPLFGPVTALEELGGLYRIHDSNDFARSTLDLHSIRASIRFMRSTAIHIADTARRLGVLDDGRAAAGILSFSYVASRLISLRLDPLQHPIAGDTRWRLIRLGWVALGRRGGGASMTVGLFVWLLGTALGPRALAAWLAGRMLLPSSRPAWVKLAVRIASLGRLTKRPASVAHRAR